MPVKIGEKEAQRRALREANFVTPSVIRENIVTRAEATASPRGAGRPKVHATNAARQKTYRGRKRQS